MDILYLIGKNCSKCDDNELRYSLRSIEKYGKNVGNIYVAGYCPKWLSDNVIKVPVKLLYEEPSSIVEKHLNMLSTILYVIDNTNINDNFLVSMDDHFYIREVDFNNYPYYAKLIGESNLLGTRRNPPIKYGRFILATKKLLERMNLPTYFFTLHRNMHLSRQVINLCRDKLQNIIDSKLPCEHMAFILNYLYNLNPFKFTSINDVKISNSSQWYKVNPEITECFSTSNFESGSELDILIKELFPDKSKYEL